MAGNKLAVDTIRLGSDANTVADSIRRFEAEIKCFEEEHQVLNTMWDGPASEVYLEVFREDILDLHELLTALKEFSFFELDSNTKYQRCADTVSEIVRSI